MLKSVFIVLLLISTHVSAEVKRYPLPNNSTFPIAQAVEVPAGTTLIYHSGVGAPGNPKLGPDNPLFWGDTEAQTHAVFKKMQASLADIGLGFGDVVKMTVFLAGVPELQDRLDFAGFMRAYTKYFGTKEQPHLPARSAVQVAGFAVPGMLVEVDVVLARTTEKVK